MFDYLVSKLLSMCEAVSINEDDLLSSEDDWDKGFIEGLMLFKGWIVEELFKIVGLTDNE